MYYSKCVISTHFENLAFYCNPVLLVFNARTHEYENCMNFGINIIHTFIQVFNFYLYWLNLPRTINWGIFSFFLLKNEFQYYKNMQQHSSCNLIKCDRCLSQFQNYVAYDIFSLTTNFNEYKIDYTKYQHLNTYFTVLVEGKKIFMYVKIDFLHICWRFHYCGLDTKPIINLEYFIKQFYVLIRWY